MMDENCRPNRRFPSSRRIKLQRDFQRVYRFRARAFNRRIAVCCAPNAPDARARLGLSVSKKVGKAHARNRWKRLIREAFRTQYAAIPQGFDFIVIPQKQAEIPTFSVLCDDLLELTARAVKKAKRMMEAADENKSSQETNEPRDDEIERQE